MTIILNEVKKKSYRVGLDQFVYFFFNFYGGIFLSIYKYIL